MKKKLHFAAKHLIVSGTVHTGHVFPQMVQWFQRRILVYIAPIYLTFSCCGSHLGFQTDINNEISVRK
jgi:hypothetical protein